MFNIHVPAWDIILRTTLVYLALLIGLRVAGKREIGQMTVFDLAVLLLIANAVQNAMVGPDTSLTGGLIAAILLIALNGLVARLSLGWPRLRRFIEGSPTVLVSRGEIIQKNLTKEGLDEETLDAAFREHGLADVSQVEMAVLEIDGSISVIPKGTEIKRVKKPGKFLKH